MRLPLCYRNLNVWSRRRCHNVDILETLQTSAISFARQKVRMITAAEVHHWSIPKRSARMVSRTSLPGSKRSHKQPATVSTWSALNPMMIHSFQRATCSSLDQVDSSTSRTNKFSSLSSSPPPLSVWQDRIHSFWLEQNRIRTAQLLLHGRTTANDETKITYSSSSLTSEASLSDDSSHWLLEQQIEICNAWLTHQQSALDLLHYHRHQLGPEDHLPTVDAALPRIEIGGEQEQPHTFTEPVSVSLLLKIICEAADTSHRLLEQIVPFLGARNAAFWTQSSIDLPPSTTSTSVVLGGEAPKHGSARPNSGTSSHATKRDRMEIDQAIQLQCDAVLSAWADAVQAVSQSSSGGTTSAAVEGVSHGKVPPPHSFLSATQSFELIRAIPQRAQFLLERMEAASTAGGSTKESSIPASALAVPAVQPSVIGYNRVIMAWAYSQEHGRGTSAERLFAKMMSSSVAPNAESYRLMVHAWALSRDPRAAFSATGYLMKMLRRLEAEWDDESLDTKRNMEPTMEDYHVVFRAWARSEEKNAPGKARSLLKLLTSVYKKGTTMTLPDKTCYRLVLQTAAKRPFLTDLGPMVVDDTLAKMREDYMVPDSECFTAAIRTWKNAALHQPDVSAADQQASVRRTLELLEEMDLAHNQSTLVSISVSTENINDVLEALTVSTHHRRIEQAEELLKRLESNTVVESSAASLNFSPNADSYIFAMKVWSTSQSMDKVAKAKDILRRSQDKLTNEVGHSKKKDRLVDIFNAFVNVCGSCTPETSDEGQFVLREAIGAIQSMRSLTQVEPNSATYAALLQACTNLLPLSHERRKAVGSIFRLCCVDGLVNESVLSHLREAAPTDLFAELVLTSCENVEGTKVVPEQWTRKALGGKVISIDGRKTTPLSVDGRLKCTSGMNEFKMRRLRDKRNRNLLRGGRLRPPMQANRSPWHLYS